METKTFTTILAILLVAVAIFTLVRFTQYYAPTGSQTYVQTNLSINTSCIFGLNLTGATGGANLTWGKTSPNATNNDNNISVNFSNTGNMPQNISINSSLFYENDSGLAGALNCNQTRYQNWSTSLLNWEAIGTYGQGICRGSTITTINRVQENQSYPGGRATESADNNTTFKINIPAGTPAARYHTNVTYYAEC